MSDEDKRAYLARAHENDHLYVDDIVTVDAPDLHAIRAALAADTRTEEQRVAAAYYTGGFNRSLDPDPTARAAIAAYFGPTLMAALGDDPLAALRAVVEERDRLRAPMKALADEVIGGDWGEMWDDPGDYPSNAGGSAMPSRFFASSDPHDLAAAVLDYLAAPSAPPAEADAGVRVALEACLKFIGAEYADERASAMEGHPLAKEARLVWDAGCAALTAQPAQEER